MKKTLQKLLATFAVALAFVVTLLTGAVGVAHADDYPPPPPPCTSFYIGIFGINIGGSSGCYGGGYPGYGYPGYYPGQWYPYVYHGPYGGPAFGYPTPGYPIGTYSPPPPTDPGPPRQGGVLVVDGQPDSQ